MAFIYFLVGVLLTIALHVFLRFFTYAQPETIRKVTRICVFALVVALIILFLRVGMEHLAAITAFLGVLLPWVDRSIRLKDILSRKKSAPQTPPPPPPPATPTDSKMTLQEAREVLDLKEGATRREILAAHKKMIRKNHPDQGGSKYLAAKINQARDVLLGE